MADTQGPLCVCGHAREHHSEDGKGYCFWPGGDVSACACEMFLDAREHKAMQEKKRRAEGEDSGSVKLS